MQQIQIVSAWSDLPHYFCANAAAQTPVGFVAVQSLTVVSEGSRVWCSGDESGTALHFQQLPCSPGQQAGAFWKDILQLNFPFAQTCFATASTDEWSEDDCRGFLWEVFPKGMKAMGRGKLRLGEQQALGYNQCFLCLLLWVFYLFLWYAVKLWSLSQKADLAFLTRKHPRLALL